MTEPLSLAAAYSFFTDEGLPAEIKNKIIHLTIFSSEKPLDQRKVITGVCKEWAKISAADEMALGLIQLGLKLKEAVLKRCLLGFYASDPHLRNAWTAHFQEKFDLANDHSLEDVWEIDCETRMYDQQCYLQRFKTWLFSLEAPCRARIRSIDFTKKELTHGERLAILEQLPELVCATFDETDLSPQSKLQDRQIPALLSLCPKLEEIALKKTMLSMEGISRLFSLLPALKHLRLIDAHSSLPGFFAALPSFLVTLDLQRSSGIPPEGFRAFTERALHLKALNLAHCKHFSEDDLCALIQNCPQLERLVLDGQYAVSNALLNLIAERGKNLKFLSYKDCRWSGRLTLEGIAAFKKSCPHLGSAGV